MSEKEVYFSLNETSSPGLVTNGDSHDHSGGDGAAITEAALSFTDLTTADASDSAHGLCPKLSGLSTDVLHGDGTWGAISGGGTTLVTGTIMTFDSDCTPGSGWLVGNGQSVSKTTYADLYTGTKLRYNKTFTAIYGGTDATSSGGAISGGDNGAQTKDLAYDNNASTYWAAAQPSGSQSGVAYIGQDFGSGATKHIRQITLQHYGAGNTVASVKFEYSDNGSSWTTVTTINSIPNDGVKYTYNISESGYHRYWRILANAESQAGNVWAIKEIEMMEADINGLISCASHGFSTAAAVNVWSSGTMYTGLTAESVTYYVRVINANIMTIHPTANDATNNTNTITLSGGSGTMYIAADGTFILPNYGTTTLNGITCVYIIKT